MTSISPSLSPLAPARLGGPPQFPTALPLASPRMPETAKVMTRLQQVLESGILTKGRELEQFEQECAQRLGVAHCIGVSSCTSGLMLVLQALQRGPAAEVARPRIAVPSFTFMASVAALIWAGFEPEFVEVDPHSMNVCLEDLERALAQPQVVGALLVHCFGNPVPTEPAERLCQQAGVPLMFDAAHGFGSAHQGQPVGRAGWCQVFSLTPTKMVIAGEGGVIATDDAHLAQQLKIAREYGNDGSYDSLLPGLNARLSEMHCVLARESLRLLDEVVAFRNQVACSMQGALSAIPGLGFQTITERSQTTYKDFTITVEPEVFGCSRDAVAWALAAEGVPTRAYFSPPCHRHTAYQRFAHRALPQTDWLADRCLSLPLLGREPGLGIAEALGRIQSQATAIGQAYDSRHGS